MREPNQARDFPETPPRRQALPDRTIRFAMCLDQAPSTSGSAARDLHRPGPTRAQPAQVFAGRSRLLWGMRRVLELSAAFLLDYLGMRTWERQSQVAKRILVVEDNDLNRKLFCDVLKANGFEVEPLADGKVALETARQLSPDLILMDIQLSEVSGVDLIEEAKKDLHLQAIPILAVTAYAAKGDEERIRAAGAKGYLSKPVSIGPFMKAVKELLPD